jgi:hypothetical protein
MELISTAFRQRIKMNKKDFIEQIKEAMSNGTFLTSKHDPEHISETHANYKTVLTHPMAQNLEEFIEFGDYIAREYNNSVNPNSPYYIELEPSPTSDYSVTASGVPKNSSVPSHAVDRLVVVSGTKQGWHIYGEDSGAIKKKEAAGTIKYLNDLK